MSRPVETPARVLLVDDHPLLRRGLRTLLECEEDLVVVGEANDGEEAVVMAGSLSPDLVVMDISMPRVNGIEATRRILADVPTTRVIALSIHSEEHFVNGMLQAGAAGYVLKDSVPEELVRAAHAVLRGEGFLSEPLLGTVISGLQSPVAEESGSVTEATAPNPLPVLQTKLYRPPLPADLVPRSRLLEQLDAGRGRPLTLVSAPAGYGKSTLLANWLERDDRPGAWISLDRDDKDLRQFMSYFVAAVNRIFPDACEESRNLTTRRQLPALATLTTTLTNELDSLEQPFNLVLDDFQNIPLRSDVNELLQNLLQRPPLPLHLVIIARRDPPLSLVSLRAAGRMTEIRLQDLRFTAAEVRSLLEKNLGFVITDEALANLELQIEGWAAGLRLVSLASRQTEDPEKFVSAIHGGVQQTREYLVEEVIEKLTPELRDWLTKCSILDRFSAPLCEAVCREEGTAEQSGLDGDLFIDAVHGGDLFTVALDARGEWFRFQNLFQEILRRELARRFSPTDIAALHVRASRWLERQGLIGGAIRHAVEAGESANAAKIVQRYRHDWLEQGRWIEIGRWIDRIPAVTLHQQPQLLLTHAWCLLKAYRLHEIPPILDQVEVLITEKSVDDALHGELDFLRGYLSCRNGDGEAALDRLEAAQRRSPPNQILQGEIQLFISLARQMTGLDAISLLKESRSDRSDAQLTPHSFAMAEASVHLLNGDLALAAQAASREPVTEKVTDSAVGWQHYLHANSQLQAHRAEEASQSFQNAIELRDSFSHKTAIDAMAGLALSYQAQQQPQTATRSAADLLAYAQETGYPEHLEVAQSCRARLSLLQGDIGAAIRWTQPHRVVPEASKLFFWLEVPGMTHARVLIASSTPENLDRAVELLTTLRQISEKLHNSYQSLQILLLWAVLLERQARPKEAVKALQRTVALARTGGWVRPFVESGPVMLQMLARLEPEPDERPFVSSLVTACTPHAATVGTQPPPARATDASPLPRAPRAPQLGRPALDALTNRELDVLELLARRLQNKEIAAQLCISSNTVNDHLKHIYQKLGVTGRRQAVERAIETGVLDHA